MEMEEEEGLHQVWGNTGANLREYQGFSESSFLGVHRSKEIHKKNIEK